MKAGAQASQCTTEKTVTDLRLSPLKRVVRKSHEQVSRCGDILSRDAELPKAEWWPQDAMIASILYLQFRAVAMCRTMEDTFFYSTWHSHWHDQIYAEVIGYLL